MGPFFLESWYLYGFNFKFPAARPYQNQTWVTPRDIQSDFPFFSCLYSFFYFVIFKHKSSAQNKCPITYVNGGKRTQNMYRFPKIWLFLFTFPTLMSCNFIKVKVSIDVKSIPMYQYFKCIINFVFNNTMWPGEGGGKDVTISFKWTHGQYWWHHFNNNYMD